MPSPQHQDQDRDLFDEQQDHFAERASGSLAITLELHDLVERQRRTQVPTRRIRKPSGP